MQYNKPPLTYQQQIELWQSRGLHIPDTKRAEHYLANISYYRFSAYALPFQTEKDSFNAGTSFQDILDLYIFDRELRLIVFNAIERLEVGIRAHIIYILAHKYGSHWQDNAAIFKDPTRIKNHKTGEYFTIDIFQEIQDIIGKSGKGKHPETFIKHYKSKYTKPNNPPSWMCLEIFTLGQLSKLYNGLKDNKDKQLIAQKFAVHHTVFSSWLHTLTFVRNICGHHGRLWNREIAIEPMWLKKPKLHWLTPVYEEVTNRSFYTICIIKYLLQSINPTHKLKEHLQNLTAAYPNVPVQYLGLPSQAQHPSKNTNWLNQDLWKN
jgi:abortive infection bacteriophage resistance protein